jgi:hypothetical protein
MVRTKKKPTKLCDQIVTIGTRQEEMVLENGHRGFGIRRNVLGVFDGYHLRDQNNDNNNDNNNNERKKRSSASLMMNLNTGAVVSKEDDRRNSNNSNSNSKKKKVAGGALGAGKVENAAAAAAAAIVVREKEKRGKFSEDEDALLVTLHEKHASDWVTVSKSIRGRTPNSCENRFRIIVNQTKESERKKAKADERAEITAANTLDMMTVGFIQYKSKADVETIVCYKCKEGDDDAKILLCDECNRAFHTYCCSPKLLRVPDGMWFCGDCAKVRAQSDEAKNKALFANIVNQQKLSKWLLCLRHGSRCLAKECTEQCRIAKNLCAHIQTCTFGKKCQFPRCKSANGLLNHYANCQNLHCLVCAAVRLLDIEEKEQRRQQRRQLANDENLMMGKTSKMAIPTIGLSERFKEHLPVARRQPLQQVIDTRVNKTIKRGREQEEKWNVAVKANRVHEMSMISPTNEESLNDEDVGTSEEKENDEQSKKSPTISIAETFKKRLEGIRLEAGKARKRKELLDVAAADAMKQREEIVAVVDVAAAAATTATTTKSSYYRPWSAVEKAALFGGVSKYGVGKWKNILDDSHYGLQLINRTNVDIKDKWRSCSRVLAPSENK